ncbi:transposable element Tcb2 transposase [Elysia marginata]|uniref:Transposable element Tcb2 transposase n=1 Tax=Elysia marginata TaxID=1093978 RepID=A0AAV4JJV2_9GAST|nr:transposable element Tcb2 transposase [Elysia marginata]
MLSSESEPGTAVVRMTTRVFTSVLRMTTRIGGCRDYKKGVHRWGRRGLTQQRPPVSNNKPISKWTVLRKLKTFGLRARRPACRTRLTPYNIRNRLDWARIHSFCPRQSGQSINFDGGSVMVWGGITAAGKTPLVTVHGNLTARRYIDEILRPHVVPAVHNQGLTFMQDNAPAHRARITSQFLYENNIPVLLT